MHALRELQLAMAAAVFDGNPDAAVPLLRPEGLEATQRLQIYRNNTRLNLTEAPQDSYPVVRRLVGNGFFAFATHHLLAPHPSRCANLSEFGAPFADFLGTFAPASTLPYLPDVARLEWAWHELYQADVQSGLDPRTLRAFPPEQYPALRFAVQPACRLLHSAYPVLSIWKANQDDAGADQIVALEEGAQRLLLVRHGLETVAELLQPGEFALLAALAAGETLGAACAGALAADSTFDLQPVLHRQLLHGTLTGVRL